MRELNDILPPFVKTAIDKYLNVDKLYEIRLRSNMPIAVNYGGNKRYLCESGLTAFHDKAITADAQTVAEVINRSCERSLYAYNDEICCGYITLDGGVRVAIAGEAVQSNGAIRTVKNFTSVNIRLPHQIKGCAQGALSALYQNGRVCGTLIFSPPCGGKTTYLRDLARLLSDSGKNVVIIDDRYEIAAQSKSGIMLDVGKCTDVLSGYGKTRAVEIAVRCFSPDVIVTDELSRDDYDAVSYAAKCGVAVLASAHADDINGLKIKPSIRPLLEWDVFERFVELKNFNAIFHGGTL